MSLEDEMVEISLVYHGQREYAEELERGIRDCTTKIAELEYIIEALFEIAPAGSDRNILRRKYQALKQPSPPAC